jgi:hypothetical protein
MKDAAIVTLLLLVGGALAILFVYVGPDARRVLRDNRPVMDYAVIVLLVVVILVLVGVRIWRRPD